MCVCKRKCLTNKVIRVYLVYLTVGDEILVCKRISDIKIGTLINDFYDILVSIGHELINFWHAGFRNDCSMTHVLNYVCCKRSAGLGFLSWIRSTYIGNEKYQERMVDVRTGICYREGYSYIPSVLSIISTIETNRSVRSPSGDDYLNLRLLTFGRNRVRIEAIVTHVTRGLL